MFLGQERSGFRVNRRLKVHLTVLGKRLRK